jgi:hypothetical protein
MNAADKILGLFTSLKQAVAALFAIMFIAFIGSYLGIGYYNSVNHGIITRLGRSTYDKESGAITTWAKPVAWFANIGESLSH